MFISHATLGNTNWAARIGQFLGIPGTGRRSPVIRDRGSRTFTTLGNVLEENDKSGHKGKVGFAADGYSSGDYGYSLTCVG